MKNIKHLIKKLLVEEGILFREYETDSEGKVLNKKPIGEYHFDEDADKSILDKLKLQLRHGEINKLVSVMMDIGGFDILAKDYKALAEETLESICKSTLAASVDVDSLINELESKSKSTTLAITGKDIDKTTLTAICTKGISQITPAFIKKLAGSTPAIDAANIGPGEMLLCVTTDLKYTTGGGDLIGSDGSPIEIKGNNAKMAGQTHVKTTDQIMKAAAKAAGYVFSDVSNPEDLFSCGQGYMIKIINHMYETFDDSKIKSQFVKLIRAYENHHKEFNISSADAKTAADIIYSITKDKTMTAPIAKEVIYVIGTVQLMNYINAHKLKQIIYLAQKKDILVSITTTGKGFNEYFSFIKNNFVGLSRMELKGRGLSVGFKLHN
jgi:hypothetical protein